MKFIFQLINISTVFLSINLLTACGGDSDSNDVPSKPNPSSPSFISIAANDISSVVATNLTSTVNLRNQVVTSNNSAVVLDTVKSISNDESCDDIEQGTLSFQVQPKESGVCIYEYQVSDLDQTVIATGISRVIAMPEDAKLATYINPSLSTISEVAETGEQIKIDLSSIAPEGFILSTDTIILGSGVIDDVDPLNNIITYTAGSEPSDVGITRIHYDYFADDGSILVGVIDVAVSTDTFNTAPVANNWHYLEVSDDGEVMDQLTVGDEVTIDLTLVALSETESGSLISDQDLEDELQLIDVRSFQGQVKLTASEDVTNTKITYTTTTPGQQDVTYQITDHNGGYATGIIRFNVVKVFKDIELVDDNRNRFFMAPLTSMEAEAFQLNTNGFKQYDEQAIEAPAGFKQPLVSWETAAAYCEAVGAKLPTVDELSLLFDQEGNIFESANSGGWPVGVSYFTSDIGSAGIRVVNLKNNESKDIDPITYEGTFSCIAGGDNNSALQLSIKESGDLPANTTQQLTAQYSLNGNGTFDITNLENYTWSSSDPEVISVNESGLLTTFSKEGTVTITMAATSNPLANATSEFSVIISVESDLFGDIRDNSNEDFAVVGDDNLFEMHCGAIVDAFGVPGNVIGGSGGAVTRTPSAINVDYIDISTSDFSFDTGGRVISQVKFTYKDGSTSTCGDGEPNPNNTNTSTKRLTIPDNYQVSGVTVYSTNYLHALRFTLTLK